MDQHSSSAETSNEKGNVKPKSDYKSLIRHIVVTVIFFTSLSMFIYQTHELILLYLNGPIVTEIKVTMNEVMQFPAVTICNLNPVRRSKWNERMNQSKPKGMKNMSLNERIKRYFRSETKTAADFANIAGTDEKKSEEIHHFLKNNRVKRQNAFAMWQTLRDSVDDNTKKITWLDKVTKHLSASAAKNDVAAFHENISTLLEHLETVVRDFETRLVVSELMTTKVAEDMAKTKSFLTFLKANLSGGVNANATEVEEGMVEDKKLPPTKDMEAFNDYMINIGRMDKEDIHRVGHQKEDFIAICSWQGSVCDPSHFNEFQNFMYGNCFTFNTSKVDAQVTGTGPYNGLSLSLFIEQNEYVDRLAPAAGARFVIHDFDHRPFPEDEGFSVAPGYTTAIFLRKSTTKTVKPMCDPDIEISFKHSEEKHAKYSRKACIKQCLSDEILRQCRCAGTQFLLKMRTCSKDNETEAKCVQRLEHLSRKNELPCYCPASCRSTTYNPMISSAVWPSEKYLPSLLEELVRVEHKVLDLFENVTDFVQYFRKHFLRVEIFFQELTEQEMSQRYSYGLESLFADIGGQLGLWIGVSVATVFESIETLTIVAVSIASWIRTQKSRKATAPLPHTEHPAVNVTCKADSKVSVVWPFEYDPHEGLESSVSRTSSKFLHVHFKESDIAEPSI